VNEDPLAIAREALARYDIEVADVTFAAQAFNTVFRVDAADGAAYAMRVGAALRIHADGCEELESRWLRELHAEGLPVVHVVATREGESVVTAGGRRCVLFDWVHGDSLRVRVTPELVHAAGVVLGSVHAEDAGVGAVAPLGALAGDRVLSFLVPNRLDELEASLGTRFTDAVERAQAALDALWRDPPHPPRLLHGDVNQGNVLVDGDRVTLIDFQDLFWGFEIQDVTIPMLALPFADAFRAGYETVRRWPEAAPETVAALEAARHLNVLNFGLCGDRPRLDAVVARHAGPIAEWMAG
jgi:Ser/Thr protein kinase RdoA (MazF antagonist)